MSHSPRSAGRKAGTIIRVDKSAGRWEAVPVSLIKDARLSLDTRGFAAWLLTNADDWEIRAGALPYLLSQISPCHSHVGRDKARRFLRELQQAGYLTRTCTRDENGCWIWCSVFNVIPATVDRLAVDGLPAGGSSARGKGVDINQTLFTTDGSTSESTKLQADAVKMDSERMEVERDEKIQFPDVLGGALLTSARDVLGACPPEQRQSVLDEVAAMHGRGALRNPMGFLYSLIQRAKAGTFIPSHAASYREKRDREARERARALELRSQSSATESIRVGETIEKVIAGLRAKFK